jgi:RHS repeat-associated protein
VVNSSAAQYQPITVDTDVTDPVTGHKFLAKTPENYTYDADGNLTQDGRWDYVWDAENRLAKMRSRSGSPAPERRIEFEYDWMGRRIRKTVFNDRDDGQGSEVSGGDTLYLYDGWNLIAELDANSSNAKKRTYIWGTDLSGTMDGAGGVGGLLMVIDHSGSPKRHYVAYDGNGNVGGLVDSTTGDWSARYEYGPFGETIRANWEMASSNPIRWSSKYADHESGLVYYGYRYYDSGTGRWISRDPIEENGGLNLFVFVENNGVNWWDSLGEQPNNKPSEPPKRPKDAYCDAAKKYPKNRWLACACNVSAEINTLITAWFIGGGSTSDNPKRNGEMIRWFSCIRQCIFKKFNEFYKVFDGGAPINSVTLTPHWEAACRICIGKPGAIASAKDCCSAMVVAEQNAIEDCKAAECGEFPGQVSRLPIPNFEGDFSKLDDRLKYGLKRCCEDPKGKGKKSESK